MLGAALSIGKFLLIKRDFLLLLLFFSLGALLGFLVSFSLSLGFLLLLGLLRLVASGLFLALILLLLFLRTVDEFLAVLLDVLIGHVEVLLRVFDLVIDLWKHKLLRGAQLLVDRVKALIQAFDSRDDILLADL